MAVILCTVYSCSTRQLGHIRDDSCHHQLFAENKLGWSLVCSHSPDDSWLEVERGFVIVSKLLVAIMNVAFHVLGQPYRLVDVQGEVSSVVGTVEGGHSKQQWDNHACSSCCHLIP